MERNSLMSFENLCKIFEMRIRLDKENNIKTSLDVFDNYEKYSKKIDSIYNSEFQKELKPLISPAVTLEKEKDRLRRLIKLLEERLDRRVELEDRYYDTTGKYLSGLQIIVSDEELELKRDRLSLISRYLETSDEINNVTDSIGKLKDSLKEEEIKKEEYESKNKIMEDELYSSFVSALKNDDYYKDLNEDDINNELDNIRSYVNETKETLDITKESIGSLSIRGINDDYASYVEEAEKNYYSYKNKEIILKIYKLVMVFEDDFKLMCSKREGIKELLYEKRELRESLVIETTDELLNFEKDLLMQCESLNNEREILDNIVNYISRIKFKEERLDELKELNEDSNILSILREYGLIETYDTDDVVLDEELEEEISPIDFDLGLPSLEEVGTEKTEDIMVETIYNPNRIVEVVNYPITLNVGLVKLKGESVREKVNKKLNPKSEEPTFEDMISLSEKEVVTNEVMESDSKLDSNNLSTGILPFIELSTSEEQVENNSISLEENKESSIKVDDLVIEENKVETPVWELPTEITPVSASVEEKLEEPVLPVWSSVEPIMNNVDTKEENNIVENVNIIDKPVDTYNNFWIPVNNEKVETSVFPTLNISSNSNINNNSEFVFPTINN